MQPGQKTTRVALPPCYKQDADGAATYSHNIPDSFFDLKPVLSYDENDNMVALVEINGVHFTPKIATRSIEIQHGFREYLAS